MHIKSAWYQCRFFTRELLICCRTQDAALETLCSDDDASRKDVFENTNTNINSESFLLELSKLIVHS